MQIYYHDTTSDNPNNYVLGYVSNDGDFLPPDEKNKYNDEGGFAVVKIIAQEGLLSAEPYEQFLARLVKRVAKKFGLYVE